MGAVEHEQAFRDLLAAGKLCGGSNYIIDHDIDLVSHAMVFVDGGIAYIDHYDRAHPHWEREHTRAALSRSTLHRPRTED